MHNPLPQVGELDASYIDDNAKLQVKGSCENAVRFLSQRSNRRIERSQTLNLLYDFTKRGPIHFFPKTSKAAPKTEKDFQHLPVVRASKKTTIKSTRTLHHLRIYVEHKLQITHHTDKVIAKGNHTFAIIRTLQNNQYRKTFTVVRYFIFILLLQQILWASPAWWKCSPTTLDRLNKVNLPALRWATGLAKPTPLGNLYRVARAPTLNLLIDYLSLNYVIRLTFSPRIHQLRPITEDIN